jgi:hypothetical protein
VRAVAEVVAVRAVAEVAVKSEMLVLKVSLAALTGQHSSAGPRSPL